MSITVRINGKEHKLDVDPEITAIARRYFEEAGVARRVELRLGPALDTLKALRSEYGPGGFDLVLFVTALVAAMFMLATIAISLLANRAESRLPSTKPAE